jgi:hypothetical protein
MICYFDGQPVQLGDSVDFDGEPATVIEVIESQKEASAMGLPEPMVGFQTDRLGAVYEAPTDHGWDGIVLLARAPTNS